MKPGNTGGIANLKSLPNLTADLPKREWKPLTSTWLMKGYRQQEEVNHFLHVLPSKGSNK